jgi:hypothetical protein
MHHQLRGDDLPAESPHYRFSIARSHNSECMFSNRKVWKANFTTITAIYMQWINWTLQTWIILSVWVTCYSDPVWFGYTIPLNHISLPSIALNEAGRAVVGLATLSPLSVVVVVVVAVLLLLTLPKMLPPKEFTYGSKTIVVNTSIPIPTAKRKTTNDGYLFPLVSLYYNW